MIQVFVSHSSRDRLAAGLPTDEVLRQEIHESTVFVALLTPNSISSVYVLFELGARWATRKPLIPLIAGGTARELLQGPLAALSALSCDSEDQLSQFIDELGVMLQRNTEARAVYQEYLTQVVAAKTVAPETSAQRQRSEEISRRNPRTPLSEDAKRLLLEATDDDKGEIYDVSTLNGRIIGTQYATFAQMDDWNAGVRWKRALDELIERGFVEDKNRGPDGPGSPFLVTEDGRWAADYLREVRPSRDARR